VDVESFRSLDNGVDEVKEFEPYADDVMADHSLKEADDYESDAFDKYIAAEVLIPRGDMLEHDKVIGRKRDKDGNLIGRNNSNPILNKTVVVILCDDGHVEEFAANVIAEHIFAQVD
jgi:hypothetical protein